MEQSLWQQELRVPLHPAPPRVLLAVSQGVYRQLAAAPGEGALAQGRPERPRRHRRDTTAVAAQEEVKHTLLESFWR